MHGRTALLTASLACAALALAPTAASAAGTGSVAAGATAWMTIAFPGSASECELTAYDPSGAPRTLSRVKPTGSKVTWLWQVPGRARTATWRLLATCGTSQLGVALTVRGRGSSGTLSLARGVRVLQYAGTGSRPDAASVRQATRVWWATDSASILAGFHTGPSAGECTAYVAARRPDVVERVDTWAYARYLRVGHGGLDVNWDAMYWARNARRAGMATGKTPRPGAVLVFQPGAYGATALGHVAYVSSVGRDGSFTITEMHAPVRGRVTSRHFDAREARAMASDPGITFIYR